MKRKELCFTTEHFKQYFDNCNIFSVEKWSKIVSYEGKKIKEENMFIDSLFA